MMPPWVKDPALDTNPDFTTENAYIDAGYIVEGYFEGEEIFRPATGWVNDSPESNTWVK